MKVGDIVKIVRSAVGDERGRYGSWVSDMDETVGREGTVTWVGNEYSGIAVFVDRTYTYPPQCLVVVGSLLPGHGPNNTHLSQELPR